MAKQHIEEQWQKFQRIAILKDCPQIQVIEMKKCFFAGAASLWSKLLMESTDETEFQPQDMQMTSEIQQEFEDYVNTLFWGKIKNASS